MKMLSSWLVLFTAILPGFARAEILELDWTSYFGETSTFQGIPFGEDTLFSLRVQFDTASPYSISEEQDATAVTYAALDFCLTIAGNTYTNDPLFTPLITLRSDAVISLGYFDGQSLLRCYSSSFASVKPVDWSALSPSLAAFSGFLSNSLERSLRIALANGAGTLEINDAGQEGASVAVVPEPSGWAMLGWGLFLGGVAGWRQQAFRMKKRREENLPAP